MKSIYRPLYLLVFLVAPVMGCQIFSSTGYRTDYSQRRITSFVDPDYVGHTYNRIAIVADTSDLDWRQRFEAKVVDVMQDSSAKLGSTLFPPTRPWTEADRIASLLANKMDGYIVVKTRQAGADSFYVQPTTKTTVIKTSRRVPDTRHNAKDSIEVEEREVGTTQSGGYYERIPWAKFEIRLVDVRTGKTAWMASGMVKGDPSNCYQQLCYDLVYQLRYDNLLRRI